MEKDYQIVVATAPHRLEEQVVAEMKRGWIPLGNPIAADIDNCSRSEWLQAMTKENDRERA